MQKAKMHNLKEKNGSWFKVTDPVIMETKKMHKQYRFCKSNTPNVIFYSLTRGYHIKPFNGHKSCFYQNGVEKRTMEHRTKLEEQGDSNG